MRTIWIGIFGLLFLITGCSSDLKATNSQVETAAGDALVITGTVRYLPFEGGFFGIVADNGEHYDPMNLDRQFAVDGLRVKIKAKLHPDQVSFHMWGKVIEIISIEKLSTGDS
ncbi:MAG: hypothetical protein JRI57_05075 [Deltaproteobacteria bacterium]|nr:hypothetical protein [Deltaproteobacteria bacterium]MBW1951757.1 hypothetical protein [Deltaproteobacteria bacterium]MBW1986847.1 hypothetical protein [Deltaproteobacteria bacterium]MBW2134971.1 hypothetical protein [Deltaproteobacteria bacterium]